MGCVLCRGPRVTGPLRLPCEQVVTPTLGQRLPRVQSAVTDDKHELIDYASQYSAALKEPVISSADVMTPPRARLTDHYKKYVVI